MKNIKIEIQQTVNLYKSQKFSEAEQLSKKLIETNPKVAFLYNLLGLILAGQGKNEEAIMYYKKGIIIKPDYAMIYNNLGTVYKSKRNYSDAENYYKKSIQLDNKITESQNNLGNLYIDLNKHEEALICFKSIGVSNGKWLNDQIFYFKFSQYINIVIIWLITNNVARV